MITFTQQAEMELAETPLKSLTTNKELYCNNLYYGRKVNMVASVQLGTLGEGIESESRTNKIK